MVRDLAIAPPPPPLAHHASALCTAPSASCLQCSRAPWTRAPLGVGAPGTHEATPGRRAPPHGASEARGAAGEKKPSRASEALRVAVGSTALCVCRIQAALPGRSGAS